MKDLFQELLEACIGADGYEDCLICGSHHDIDHVSYDDDTSCVVSKILQMDRAVETRSFFTGEESAPFTRPDQEKKT